MADSSSVGPCGASEEGPLQVESLCMRCSENGTTSILTTHIPHFRDVVIMAFECAHCGTRNNELQPTMTCEERGVFFKLAVQAGSPELLSRQFVKSDAASVKIPELEFEIPAAGGKGCLTTVEGLLRQAIGDLMELQEERHQADPVTASKLDAFCAILESYANGEHSFTVEIDDPSGNSFIESPFASMEQDIYLHKSQYTRTPQQTQALGLVANSALICLQGYRDSGRCVGEVENTHHGAQGRGFTLDPSLIMEASGNAFLHQYSAPEEVMVFPGSCLICHKETETRMYPTKIPYFKEVIVMANSCESCGYKNSEVRPGGGIPAKGNIGTLNVKTKEDLNRDVIKSDTASLEIPSLAVQLRSGTAMITTVEGLIRRIIEDLQQMSSFQLGDSAEESTKEKFRALFASLEQLLECNEEWSFSLRDPLANSFIMPAEEKLEDDQNLIIQEYERSAEENEEFGIDELQKQQDDG